MRQFFGGLQQSFDIYVQSVLGLARFVVVLSMHSFGESVKCARYLSSAWLV